MKKSKISAISLPGYRITEVIHISTRTSVYRGKKEKTETPVIIKTLNAQYPQLHELIALKNQFTITQKIDHPHIIKCYQLEPYNNSYALITEDIYGISLHQYANSQPLNLDIFFKIALAITDALDFLYQNKIIHKDIKPKNIIINPQNQKIKLIDFSISCLLPKEVAEIKNPNILEGTLPYMSPEQTGRMNRGIDYRTDFYSLGVTFYELLTGQLPFNSDNPLELVYSHIAKIPNNPREINPQISDTLANLILKLMAKIPEERYQTAKGIRHDLEICQQMLVSQNNIINFELGQRDKSEKFIISEKIYGRDDEIITLLDTFDRVSNGNKELMLVAGFSGIGKTAVINEIHKPIVRQKGCFIAGKYDQFQRNVPFSALLKALHSLLQQLLTESTENLQAWKEKILSALADQGQVIIDVIPELENIIGQQPAIPEITGNAAQNRFNLLFSKFIQVFATKEHPLVIFLDDLQWADVASLKLIELLISDTDTKYLLLIGAYRDNEIYPGHPLIMTLDNMRKANTKINQINLQPLNSSHLNLLISDTLFCHQSQTLELTELLLKTTKGNPFFTNQLMKSMYEDGLISFNFHLGYWQCDLYAAQVLYQNNNIVRFLESQIQKLPEDTQNILKIAACIGNQFDLATLAIICQKSQLEIASALWNALKKGLILPQDERYKFFTDGFELSTANLEITNAQNLIVNYKFLHDQVQQAAYFLIPNDEKPAMHLKIGQLIFQHTQAEELEEKIFAIVNQLNIGIDLVSSESEKYQLAQLNLIAGHKAKLSTAYEAAVRYLKLGLELLPEDSWQYQYDLTLKLYVEAVEAEYLNINFEQAEIYIEIVKQNANNLLDQVQVYEAQIQMYMAQLQMQLVIDTGLKLLDMLGVKLNESIPPQLNVEDLINLPILTAPDKLAAIRILISMSAAAYFVNPELLLPIILTMINLSINYGNSAFAAYVYVVYGLILCGAFSDIDTAYRYGQLALNLTDKFDARDITFKVRFFWYSTIRCWKQHLRESIIPLQENLRYGLEVGDLEYVGYCATNHYFNLIFAGENLGDVFRCIEQHGVLMHKLKQQWSIDNQKFWKQMVFNLMEVNAAKSLSGDFVNDELFTSFVNTKNYNSIFAFHLAETILFYFFKDTKNALNSANLGKPYIASVTGQILVSQHIFYYSLALLAECSHLSDENAKLAYIEQVNFNQEQMRNWAVHAPMNYQHKYDLIEAEKARILGNTWEAMKFYDQAIAGARENKYIQEEALGNELAAEFYLINGREKIAQVYLIDAYYGYVNWGAKAKVEDLEKLYPQLLAPVLQQKVIESEAPALISKIISDSSNVGVSAILDLETVNKASLAISSEIHIDKLLATLLQVIIENMGAKKALLFLEEDSKLTLVSQLIENQQGDVKFIPVDNEQELPFSIINYVNNTREPLLINNAIAENPFAIDPYIIRHQAKSIMCNPILNQGQLIGIIYVENNLNTEAFTSERLKILQILSSQAAIALENAQLYAKLEDKVAERTQELNEKNLRLEKAMKELKLTQLQLIQTEKMSSLGQMVAGIAHEINNPVNFIYANVDYANSYIDSLISLINIYQQEYPEPTNLIKQKLSDIELDFLMADLPKILNSMAVGAERIRQLVLGLRNFSRLDESGRKPVDIHEGIDSTLMILQPRFKEKLGYSQNLVIKDYGKLPLVPCYVSQLNQVFMNIISNAIDALHKHEQDLSPEERDDFLSQIKITTSMTNNDWVRISIQDNAMGITPEIKQQIFDPFFTTKPVGEGTGLGLSISYQIIVDKHGGRIDCVSEPGEGTEFIIEIPVNLNDN